MCLPQGRYLSRLCIWSLKSVYRVVKYKKINLLADEKGLCHMSVYCHNITTWANCVYFINKQTDHNYIAVLIQRGWKQRKFPKKETYTSKIYRQTNPVFKNKPVEIEGCYILVFNRRVEGGVSVLNRNGIKFYFLVYIPIQIWYLTFHLFFI